ncbi:MAG TPA: ornithine carbamoyltransferase [Ilumatobacteraceae bacterium]
MTRHFLDVTDLSVDEVHQVLDLATVPPPSLGRPLDGRGVALIFEKPSNRTRHSMEMAVVQLGGHPVYTRGDEVGFDTREPVEDIARIMAGYHAMIAARVFDHTVLERMTTVVDVPVVNMLSDRSHPLQALADALTMVQCLGALAGRRVAWVGDYNNVARSLGEICSMLGMHVRFACPPGYDADDAELERLALLGAASVDQSMFPAEAVNDADAVHTDTWVSMGQESDKQERISAFESFTVDQQLMSTAAPGAVFLHCLPAYRGLEVTADVIDGPQSVVFQQGHNRMHAARGLLALLAGVSA